MKNKTYTFKVGDRVVLPERSNLEEYNPYDGDDTTRGEIQSINKDGGFSIKWDHQWIKPNPSSHDASELMTEAEADQILSELEEEYEAWAGPIRDKMEQAAKLLAEAGELANKQEVNLTEMHDIVGPLIGAIDDLGWRTSSLSC